jgi:hypothetical protein
LRLKNNEFVENENEIWHFLDSLVLKPGVSLFLQNLRVTKSQKIQGFNLAAKWKRTFKGWSTEEGWFLFTNLTDLTSAINYKKPFDIERSRRHSASEKCFETSKLVVTNYLDFLSSHLRARSLFFSLKSSIKPTYIFVNLTPEESAASLLKFMQVYIKSSKGAVAWKQLPELLQSAIFAQIPPVKP